MSRRTADDYPSLPLQICVSEEDFHHASEAAANGDYTELLRSLQPRIIITRRQASLSGHAYPIQLLLDSGVDLDSCLPSGSALH